MRERFCGSACPSRFDCQRRKSGRLPLKVIAKIKQIQTDFARTELSIKSCNTSELEQHWLPQSDPGEVGGSGRSPISRAPGPRDLRYSTAGHAVDHAAARGPIVRRGNAAFEMDALKSRSESERTASVKSETGRTNSTTAAGRRKTSRTSASSRNTATRGPRRRKRSSRREGRSDHRGSHSLAIAGTHRPVIMFGHCIGVLPQ
jgi:hypothetical protein